MSHSTICYQIHPSLCVWWKALKPTRARLRSSRAAFVRLMFPSSNAPNSNDQLISSWTFELGVLEEGNISLTHAGEWRTRTVVAHPWPGWMWMYWQLVSCWIVLYFHNKCGSKVQKNDESVWLDAHNYPNWVSVFLLSLPIVCEFMIMCHTHNTSAVCSLNSVRCYMNRLPCLLCITPVRPLTVHRSRPRSPLKIHSMYSH